MRTRPTVMLCALLGLAVGAAAQSVKVEADKATDFSVFRTFAWKPGAPVEGPGGGERWAAWDRRLVAGVGAELEARGLSEKPEAEADLLLQHATAVAERSVKVTGRGQGGGSTQGLGAVGTFYREAVFTLEMIDRKAGKTVWSGKVTTEVEKQEAPDPLLDQVSRKLLKKFPPGKK